MELDYCAIGTRIKERRAKKKWTQEMLASAVGISNPHMSNTLYANLFPYILIICKKFIILYENSCFHLSIYDI